MLGVLCARPKPWISSAISFVHGAIQYRLTGSPISVVINGGDRRFRHHSSACRLGNSGGGAVSIWHAILPSGGNLRSNLRPAIHCEQKGEGSWNVALDVRPARWLHGSDSAWLLFGVCPCLSPLDCCFGNLDAPVIGDGVPGGGTDEIRSDGNSIDYRVTGVLADGRCLFRSLAYGDCLRSGKQAPDDTHQTQLADNLRAQVVDELLKRREEAEWFIEGDFDTYVKSIQQPNAWGGEPELLMASHVLRTPITVFMRNRSSNDMIKIASYGQEYGNDKESPIKVLFHGYGHYDVLETFSNQNHKELGI